MGQYVCYFRCSITWIYLKINGENQTERRRRDVFEYKTPTETETSGTQWTRWTETRSHKLLSDSLALLICSQTVSSQTGDVKLGLMDQWIAV